MPDNQLDILPDTREELIQLHDDILLKLSLMQMQDDEIQRVLVAMDSSEAEAVYVSYKARSGDRIKHHIPNWIKQEAHPPRARITLRKAFQIAAVAIAILSISLATAIAAVPAIRVSVLTLLINMQDRYTELSLVHNTDMEMTVPPEWQGDFFPSYIPTGYNSVSVENLGSKSSVVFSNDSGSILEFSEMSESVTTQIDTENATNEFSNIHGSICLISTKHNHVSVVWMQNDKYFYLYFGGEKEEAQRIAESLVYIR
ncbi:MAG: DUF4367 domain-containing protein [Candidatus Limiplasma sp.]|nr:DUF4367 domain-containing protein [Candidatus Limiplasma sp.]